MAIGEKTVIEYVTFEQLAERTHPDNPEAQRKMLEDLRQAKTEICSVCGTATYLIHAYTGPMLEDGGNGIFDICNDCWRIASKTAALLGVDLEEVEQRNDH